MYVAVKKGITIAPPPKKFFFKEQTETIEYSVTLSWVEKEDIVCSLEYDLWKVYVHFLKIFPFCTCCVSER